ncbi:hypothetical protein PG988_012739 [Apiospora saccharicola]
MSFQQTKKHETVKDGQREDGSSRDVITKTTLDTSEDTQLSYDAQEPSTKNEGMAMPRTKSSGQPVRDGIGTLVCGMLCYLNIMPIISRHLQTVATGDKPKDSPFTNDAIPQKCEIEVDVEIHDKLKEEVQLQKDMLESQKCQLRRAFWDTKRVERNNQHFRRALADTRTQLNNKQIELEAAKNLIKFQEEDLREAGEIEADRRSLYAALKEMKSCYRKAHYSLEAALANLSKAAERDSIAEEEIRALRLELEETQERERAQSAANYDVCCDWIEANNKVTDMEEEIRKLKLELEESEERERAQQAANYDDWRGEICQLKFELDLSTEREKDQRDANHDICVDWLDMKRHVRDQENANRQLYNTLGGALDRLRQAETDRDELRNACLALLRRGLYALYMSVRVRRMLSAYSDTHKKRHLLVEKNYFSLYVDKVPSSHQRIQNLVNTIPTFLFTKSYCNKPAMVTDMSPRTYKGLQAEGYELRLELARYKASQAADGKANNELREEINKLKGSQATEAKATPTKPAGPGCTRFWETKRRPARNCTM